MKLIAIITRCTNHMIVNMKILSQRTKMCASCIAYLCFVDITVVRQWFCGIDELNRTCKPYCLRQQYCGSLDGSLAK
jgi:hypothetical protein